ncbi:MAG: type II toxin-antitoxin system RelE/ParE family toxin [Acetobacter sp.]|nr:type II toxin-antitoxin system RelE/ParE family toxin [Acetobacter sp.]
MTTYKIIQTETFEKWLKELDNNNQTKILEYIRRPQTIAYIEKLKEGKVVKNLGRCIAGKDCPYKDDLFEIKIRHYRVYFALIGHEIILITLLHGGSKNNKSEQSRDIKKAFDIAADLLLDRK